MSKVIPRVECQLLRELGNSISIAGDKLVYQYYCVLIRVMGAMREDQG